MSHVPGDRSFLTAALLTLLVALALCAGGLALQSSHATSATGDAGHGSEMLSGSHLQAPAESPEPSETVPADYEHLSALAFGLFLVSLGLLLGAGFVGRAAERRLLERLRLPAVLPFTPSRRPLSALEVFRL